MNVKAMNNTPVESPDINVFWDWSGRYVGYRSSDGLFGSDGRQMGYFAEGDEVYGCNGEYMGEVRSGNRLITNLSKRLWTRGGFIARILKTSPRRNDINPKQMLAGFQDFGLSRNQQGV